VGALREGKIVALKGIGGFQLLVDACNEYAVQRLRERKRREEKPFAVMVPSLEALHRVCVAGPLEERLLLSPESPIVLLEKRNNLERAVAPNVAPGNPYLGLMLPYSPLHHILLNDFNGPLVATSGNLTDEPICTSTREALERLGGIADFFLTHDRPIFRYVDDSVVRVVAGRSVVLRRARGYAPLPVAQLPEKRGRVLAFGAHLKNTVAVAVEETVFLSQHIGDLDTEPAVRAHERTVKDLTTLYQSEPEILVCDLHPDYASTRSLERKRQRRTLPPVEIVRVPHHYAHVVAAIAEHRLFDEDVLGIAWDGTGLGLDRTIWGSEFLKANRSGFQRLGHFRYFRGLGGDRAMREPRRSALSVLTEVLGSSAAGAWFEQHHPGVFEESELRLFEQMFTTGLNSPWTCGAGRLFDAVASVLGIRHRCSFEGQAAMELEWYAARSPADKHYPVVWSVVEHSAESAIWPVERITSSRTTRVRIFDWAPMVQAILADIAANVPAQLIAARFHATLVETIVDFARFAEISAVVLTGGCFQNRLLAEGAINRLEQEGLRVFIHERVPPNDGGVAVGQAVAAAYWHLGRNTSVSCNPR
ncbi:MAG: carbamoyltransferase HypF, partial [Candidatus Sumerlaeaceae bacterium]|nr:carbamoyltransferase HypF [Candidatus Sumerlaeaceae bacterium]